jgi:hypothetical protein
MTKPTFRDETSGAVSAVFAVMLLGILMTAGLAVIATDADRARDMTLQALDTAVLAGASAPSDTTDAVRVAIAQNFYDSNQSLALKRDSSSEFTTSGSGGSGFVAANFGTTDTTVYGEASIRRKIPFLGLFGTDHLTIPVHSAATKAEEAPICLLGLDPTEEATMDFNGQASLELKNCASMANSSDGSGMRQVGQPSMKAKAIGVNGGFSGSAYEPEPQTGVNPIKDPLASLPEPPTGACMPMSGAKLTNDSATLDPGTYCGGLTILNSTVTLNPGIYIMKDGALDIQAGSVVQGREVMLAFFGEGATMYLIGDAKLTVTSPTSGNYENIQFFGDRNVYGRKQENLWFTVIGGSELKYDGVIYLPSFHLWFAGHSVIEGKSPNYTAIAKKLWFQDNTVVKMEQKNERGLSVEASKSIGSGSRLIE